MRLLKVLLDPRLAATEPRWLDQCRPMRAKMPERRFGGLDDGVVIDSARRRNDDVLGRVTLVHEGREVMGMEFFHPLGWPQNRAAQRLLGKGGFLQPVEDHVVWRVVRLPDLLQYHVPFDLYLARVEDRVQHDVGDDVQRQPNILGQNPCVIGRHLAAGIGVDVAAYVFDGLGDLQGRAGFGALERHVLKEMRNAVLLDPLVTATGSNPDAQRGRGQTRHVLGHDANAVGQSVKFNRHFARFSRIIPSIAARSLATRVTRSGRS